MNNIKTTKKTQYFVYLRQTATSSDFKYEVLQINMSIEKQQEKTHMTQLIVYIRYFHDICNQNNG